MTIPIIPGPFSFLAELGRGVGTAFQTAENQRRVVREEKQQDRAEALKQAGVIYEAVKNNQLSASALKSPFFQSILERSGILQAGEQIAPTVAAKPEEQVREAQSQALTGILPTILQGGSQYQKEQLAAGNIPTAQGEQESRAATGKARTQADTIEGGGAAGRAAAGVTTEQVASAAEEGAKDQFYNTVAGRTVDASLRTQGGNILKADLQQLSDNAWALAQQDAKSRNYTLDEQLTRPYIDAAIQSRMREALTEEARVRAAQARGQDTLDDYMKILQNNQQRIRDQINALPKPSDMDIRFADAYKVSLQRAGNDPQKMRDLQNNPSLVMTRSAYERVQQYQATVDRLNRELEGNRDELNNALAQSGRLPAGTVGGATPGREARKLSEQTIDQIVQRMRSQNIGPEQIDRDVQAGKITAADGAAIKERLTMGAGGRF